MKNVELLKREVVYDFGNEFGEFNVRDGNVEAEGYQILTVNGKEEYILNFETLRVGDKIKVYCPEDWFSYHFIGKVVVYNGDSFAILDGKGKSYEFYPMYRRGCFAYAKKIE